MLKIALFAALLVQDKDADRTQKIQEGLKRADWLLGAWTGAAKGVPGEGTGTESWEAILDGCFYQSKEKWKVGDKVVHEATSLMTYDPDRGRLIMHHIQKSGSYHFYVASPSDDAKSWVFNEPYKDKMRTRITYTKTADGEYSGKFEMEDDKGTWSEFVTWSVKKSP